MSDGNLPEPLLPAARALFGVGLEAGRRYAELLVTQGVLRGLIGPRETSRIWERHLLNSVALAELIPTGSSVIDVGSGAGLPGIPLALARPDLTVVLLDSMVRRTDFMIEAVAELDLDDRVSVVRARAEQSGLDPVDVVTARAVAPVDRLAAWCLPLVVAGGRLLAIKGESAADELAAHPGVVERLGGSTPVIRRCAAELLSPPTTVVEIVRKSPVGSSPSVQRSPGSRSSARGSARSGRTVPETPRSARPRRRGHPETRG